MVIKILTLLLITFLSFNVYAERSHIELAIQYSEAALYAKDEKSLVEHAQEAKIHANAAKNEKVDNKHLLKGIERLDNAGREAQAGKMNAATKAAKAALYHFKLSTR